MQMPNRPSRTFSDALDFLEGGGFVMHSTGYGDWLSENGDARGDYISPKVFYELKDNGHLSIHKTLKLWVVYRWSEK